MVKFSVFRQLTYFKPCYFYIVLLTALFLSSCSKQEPSQAKTPEVSVTLKMAKSLSDSEMASVEFNISEGWHIYGPLKQNNGRPTFVNIEADGSKTEDLIWPRTVNFDEGQSGLSEGYSGTFSVDAVLRTIPQKLEANVSWVACKDICVPGNAKLSLQP